MKMRAPDRYELEMALLALISIPALAGVFSGCAELARLLTAAIGVH